MPPDWWNHCNIAVSVPNLSRSTIRNINLITSLEDHCFHITLRPQVVWASIILLLSFHWKFFMLILRIAFNSSIKLNIRWIHKWPFASDQLLRARSVMMFSWLINKTLLVYPTSELASDVALLVCTIYIVSSFNHLTSFNDFRRMQYEYRLERISPIEG